MKTTDLFKSNRSATKLNESLEKVFGQRINLEAFDLPQLQDARNKLRTQISQVRSQSGFNETIENEALTKAQWMLDAINAEMTQREDIYKPVQEAASEADMILQRLAQNGDFDEIYNALGWYKDPRHSEAEREVGDILQDIYKDITSEYGLHGDDDFEKIIDIIADRLEQDYGDGDVDNEPSGSYDSSDDADALASAGHGSDEDYGFGYEEDTEMTPAQQAIEKSGKAINDIDATLDAEEKIKSAIEKEISDIKGKITDAPGNVTVQNRSGKVGSSKTNWAGKDDKGNPVAGGAVEDQQNEFFYFDSPKGKDRGPRDTGHDELERRAKSKPNLGGKDARDYKDAKKQGQYKIGGPKGKLPENTQGEDMKKVTEGEIQQAQSIVTAKTMVDRVGRWIEELSGMENDTLLQLGDQIRDEMGSEQAKNFISAVAPAIQQALENLKTTRETLATGVRTLTGEEQAAGMLGAEPGAEGGDELTPAGPDEMNAEPAIGGEDEFAAAEPAAGGLEDAGREQRESIQYQNKLLRVLAG